MTGPVNTQTDSREPILLPGFGLPLNYTPMEERPDVYPSSISKLFPNALDEDDLENERAALPMITAREVSMVCFMDAITDKENWHAKVFDPEVEAAWREEMLAGIQKEDGDEDEDEEKEEEPTPIWEVEGKERGKGVTWEETTEGAGVVWDVDEDDEEDSDDEEEETSATAPMADWILAEVKHKVEAFKKNGFISAYPGDVVKSDTAIPPDLRDALKAAVKVLEDIPDRDKDWHPGSDGKVLDLVHPSLFPVIYGRTRILKDQTVTLEDCIRRCGEGKVLPIPPEEEACLASWNEYKQEHRKDAGKEMNIFSRKFQWLPCDVALEDDGNVKIKSYINNLHPQKYANLYGIIEQIISRAIPLWNATLTPLLPVNTALRKHRRIDYTACRYDPDPEREPQEDEPKQEEGEDEDDFNERLEDWYDETRQVVLPEPGEFVPPPEPMEVVDLFRGYKEKGLQVIVKMANIELTPESPNYGGGSWHVEGQLNEHICASAIYYYDTHNITESRLAFRQQSLRSSIEGVSYRQDHHDWLDAVYKCHQSEPAVQVTGAPITPEGRLLTWPNILQHQVGEFELEDPTQRGWRKIVALFLVDPNIRVISTANVPVQRKDWWAESVRENAKSDQNLKDKATLGGLPAEVQDRIFDDVEEFPISLEEAKELRLELMEERKVYQTGVDDAFHMHRFSLCEH